MIKRQLRKPHIVPLIVLIAALFLVMLYTSQHLSEEDTIELYILLGCEILTFMLYLIVICMDISWASLFSLRSFKCYTVIAIIIITATASIAMIYPNERYITWLGFETLGVAILMMALGDHVRIYSQ